MRGKNKYDQYTKLIKVSYTHLIILFKFCSNASHTNNDKNGSDRKLNTHKIHRHKKEQCWLMLVLSEHNLNQ